VSGNAMCCKNDFQRDEDKPSHEYPVAARRNKQCRLTTISWLSRCVLALRLTATIHT
jgi:hypothetical protein